MPRGKNALRPIIIQSNAAFVLLTRGKVSIIDKEDLELVRGRNFQYMTCPGRNTGYATAWNPDRSHSPLHRLVMGVTDPNIHVDHIDGNGLNNSRSNLRLCTNAQNAMNRRIKTGKGAYFRADTGRWRAVVRYNQKNFHCGYFDTQEEAHNAYDNKARELFGEFALPNEIIKKELAYASCDTH